jgi:hypothetical protein
LNFFKKLFEECAGEALFDPDLAGVAWLIFPGFLVLWGIYMILLDPQWGGIAGTAICFRSILTSGHKYKSPKRTWGFHSDPANRVLRCSHLALGFNAIESSP